jgi:hypothetical protein
MIVAGTSHALIRFDQPWVAVALAVWDSPIAGVLLKGEEPEDGIFVCRRAALEDCRQKLAQPVPNDLNSDA